MNKKLLDNKMKYGILHIPTGLVLRTYLLDPDEGKSIDEAGDETLFDSKEDAEQVLDAISIKGVERKKTRLTPAEKEAVACISYWHNQHPKLVIPASLFAPGLTSFRKLELNNGDEITWSPTDTLTLYKKYSPVDCVMIPEEVFFRSAGLEDADEDYDEFKKRTSYDINRHSIYPRVEFEIVEYSTSFKVKRPSVHEFRSLVQQILNDTNASPEIVEKVKQYIRD